MTTEPADTSLADEEILRTIRMSEFGELYRSSRDEWWCYVYTVTESGRQERHGDSGDTAAQACRHAVAAMARARRR